MENFKQFFKRVNDSIVYDPDELKMGIEVEHEHTNNKGVAETIAKKHLEENPKYYTILKKAKL